MCIAPQEQANWFFLTKEAIMAAQRIGPQQARQDMQGGALLVCAYDSQEKFEQNHLEGAISLDEFHAMSDSLPKDREIIFYCG